VKRTAIAPEIGSPLLSQGFAGGVERAVFRKSGPYFRAVFVRHKSCEVGDFDAASLESGESSFDRPKRWVQGQRDCARKQFPFMVASADFFRIGAVVISFVERGAKIAIRVAEPAEHVGPGKEERRR